MKSSTVSFRFISNRFSVTLFSISSDVSRRIDRDRVSLNRPSKRGNQREILRLPINTLVNPASSPSCLPTQTHRVLRENKLTYFTCYITHYICRNNKCSASFFPFPTYIKTNNFTTFQPFIGVSYLFANFEIARSPLEFFNENIENL